MCKNLTGQVKKEQIEAHETENFMYSKGNTVEQTDSVEKMCASDPSDRGLISIVYIFKLQKKKVNVSPVCQSTSGTMKRMGSSHKK